MIDKTNVLPIDHVGAVNAHKALCETSFVMFERSTGKHRAPVWKGDAGVVAVGGKQHDVFQQNGFFVVVETDAQLQRGQKRSRCGHNQKGREVSVETMSNVKFNSTNFLVLTH